MPTDALIDEFIYINIYILKIVLLSTKCAHKNNNAQLKLAYECLNSVRFNERIRRYIIIHDADEIIFSGIIVAAMIRKLQFLDSRYFWFYSTDRIESNFGLKIHVKFYNICHENQFI